MMGTIRSQPLECSAIAPLLVAVALLGSACDDGDPDPPVGDADMMVLDIGADDLADTAAPDTADASPLCGFETCADGERCCDFACVDTSADTANCGACGVSCAEGQACVDGQCTCGDTRCSSAERCCDSAGALACQNVEVDPNHCGACGVACDPAEVCFGGTCACPGPNGTPSTCSASESCCPDAGCTSLLDDPLNCGGCGVTCGSGELCVDGACACGDTLGAGGAAACTDTEACCGSPPTCQPREDAACQCGTSICGSGENCCTIDDGGATLDACISTWRTREHCGACGNVCGDGEACRYGTCICEDGRADCDGDPSNGCEAPLGVDPAHCGACGNACAAGERCNGDGQCELSCLPGFTDCDGVCVDLDWDREHCGACGNACEPGEVANGAGECAPSCLPGFTDCGGECVSLLSNLFNCGVCGAACAPGQICDGSGQCGLSCQVGLERCGSECVDLTWDRLNCGACGVRCQAGEVCDDGACTLGCPAWATECNGGCVDTDTNAVHCGACGNSCTPGEVCTDGACGVICPAGLEVCAGRCTDTAQSSLNCGACGNTCTAGERCLNGACVEPSCPAGFLFCGASGCIDTDTDSANCGACGNDCGGSPCVTGVCCAPGACGIQTVATASALACAIDGGRLACWGGVQSDGAVANSATPAPVPYYDASTPATTARELALLWNTACVVSEDDSVRCWGYNEDGEAGQAPSTTPVATPTLVPGLDGTIGVRELVAQDDHVCALRTDGQVVCWGRAGLELGWNADGSPLVRSELGRPLALGFQSNGSYGCGIYAVDDAPDGAGGTRSTTAVSCWGNIRNSLGAQTDTGSAEVFWLADETGDRLYDVVDLAPPCVILTDGSMRCSPGIGQCTVDCAADRLYPVAIEPGASVASFRALARPTMECALTIDGRVFCRGTFLYPGNDDVFYEVKYASGQPLDAVERLVAGDRAACAARSNGEVACLGDNGFGTLGRGTAGSLFDEREILDLGGPVDTLVGDRCARTAAGTLHCWGDATPPAYAPTPVDVSATLPADAVDVAVDGYGTTCVIDAAGAVSCMGVGANGQLGDGCVPDMTCPPADSPTTALSPVVGLDGTVAAVELSAGRESFCARLDDGSVWCWGDNSHGQLGDGTTTPSGTPLEVTLADTPTHLVSTRNATCARLQSGAIQCWGLGTTGVATVFDFDGTVDSAAAIDSSTLEVAFVRADGSVGVMGSGFATIYPVPGTGTGGVVPVQISHGFSHLWMRTAGGEVLATQWGGSAYTMPATWLDYDGTVSIEAIESADYAMLARAADGSLEATGRFLAGGQVGTTTYVPEPVLPW